MTVTNIKTGTQANPVSSYNRRSDNKAMYEVFGPAGTAYWLASNCEVA